MDVFCHERELSELFKSKNINFTITFNINSWEVTIFLGHFGDWDSQKGKVIWDTLWKNFKLQLIGWENDCKLLSYKGFIEDDIVSEYVFTMRKFYFWKTRSIDFLSYDNNYISALTKQNKGILETFEKNNHNWLTHLTKLTSSRALMHMSIY